jgi:hypothetical protein
MVKVVKVLHSNTATRSRPRPYDDPTAYSLVAAPTTLSTASHLVASRPVDPVFNAVFLVKSFRGQDFDQAASSFLGPAYSPLDPSDRDAQPVTPVAVLAH